MSFWDFNDAPQQQSGELIPAKTRAKVVSLVRPGKHGDGGWLTRSDSGFEYLDFEFTIMSEPYAKRKVWQVAGVGGVTPGHEKAAEITRALLRAMLESARGIDPKAEDENARKARQVESWSAFSNLEFAVEIGIEKDKTGQYPDKNKVLKVITPDHKDYKRVMAGETIVPDGAKASTGGSGVPATGTPAWAQGGQPTQEQKPDPVPAWAR